MERDIQIQAVVTGTRKYGDIHKSVSLFSPEMGLIQAIIYGGRKGKKTSLAPLFSFGTFQIYHNPVKNEYSIVESDCSFNATKINQDINLNCTASYICETATRINTDSPIEVYNLVTSALKHLEEEPAKRRIILIAYTFKLLIISGIGTDMKTCPSCDKEYSDNQTLYFSSSLLSPVCRNCADSDQIIIPPGAKRYLSYTYNMSFEEALKVELFESSQERLTHIMTNWITKFCQWPLKTVQSGLL